MMIPNRDAQGNIIIKTSTFADKANLFFRGQGITGNATANQVTNFIFTVPYAKCKINGVEILGGVFGAKCNLKILDSTTGTYTGTPNALLNQFGYDWNIRPNCMPIVLPYDADLLQGMQILIEYENNDSLDTSIAINFYLHEDKS